MGQLCVPSGGRGRKVCPVFLFFWGSNGSWATLSKYTSVGGTVPPARGPVLATGSNQPQEKG